MSKSKILFIVIIGLLLVWGGRVIAEFDLHSSKEPNSEYTQYINDYQAEIEDKIEDFKSDIGSDLSIVYDAQLAGPGIEKCISNNFEGATVKVYGMQFFDKVYGQASESGYDWSCNEATLDPDHQYFGLPSISVEVQDVTFFNPSNTGFAAFNQWMGAKKDGPYRTYEKQMVVTDSAGNSTMKKFAMELWLTKFNVTVSV